MKNILKPTNLPFLTLGSGGIGLLLRIILLTAGADDRGLLAANHPAEILIWILTAIVMAGLIYLTKDLVEATKYRFNFPASDIGGIGAYIAALGFAISSLVDMLSGSDMLGVISATLGLASVPALVFLGQCRRRGQHPTALFHIVISLFLMVRLVSLYRHWSSDPQLQDYCFQLLATVCLMLASYHRATFDADAGKRRPYAFFNLAAVYFCCLSLTDWADITFFLAAGVWMITDLCSLIPMPGTFRTRSAREEA